MSYKFYANCCVRGTVDLTERKDIKSTNGGDDFEILNISIKSGENRIRGKILNSKSNPNFINEIFRGYKKGDKVTANGRLVERHYLNKSNRDTVDKTPIFFKIADAGADEVDSATFMIQGYVKGIKEVDDGEYKVMFDVFNEDKDGNISLETFETDITEKLYSEFDEQGFAKGSYVKVTGYMFDKLILDEFNQVVEVKRGLSIAKLYTCVAEDELDEGEAELYDLVKKASKAGKKAKRKSAEEDADEEQPKPKGKRKSAFTEDDE